MDDWGRESERGAGEKEPFPYKWVNEIRTRDLSTPDESGTGEKVTRINISQERHSQTATRAAFHKARARTEEGKEKTGRRKGDKQRKQSHLE